MESTYMTSPEAAEYTGLSESYLAKLRMGTAPSIGPRYLKVGLRAVRYFRNDLDAWMHSKACGHSRACGGRT